MKRIAHPPLSRPRQEAFALCEHWLREQEDLTRASIHNHLNLRHRFGYQIADSVSLHRLAQIMGHDFLDTTKLYILKKGSTIKSHHLKLNFLEK
jgi:hypothetical protein